MNEEKHPQQNPEPEDNRNTTRASVNPAQAAMDKLIQLNEKAKMQNAPDLNSRLADIESQLKHLNAREGASNRAFRELMSETRKFSHARAEEIADVQEKIQGISSGYKQLTQDYQRLAASANILSANFEHARDELRSDLSELKSSSEERLDELADGQLQLIERARRIEQRAAQMSNDLETRISVVDTTIISLEKHLLEKMQEIATQSEQRDESLGIRIDSVEENFNSEIQRLDEQANALLSHTDDLQMQAQVLDTRTSDLEERSESLEASDHHQLAALHALKKTLQRHQRGFSLAIVLLAAVLVFAGFYQQQQAQQSLQADSQINSNIEENAMRLQQQAATQQAADQRIEQRVTQLENRSVADDKDLAQTVSAQQQQLDQLSVQLQQVQQQSVNSEQRISALAPHRSFGLDNTIHDAAWLAQQNPEHFVIEVMQAESLDALYRLAVRWSTLFNHGHLSALQTASQGDTGYRLIYGPFADSQQAQQLLYRIPAFSYEQRPALKKVSEL